MKNRKKFKRDAFKDFETRQKRVLSRKQERMKECKEKFKKNYIISNYNEEYCDE